MIPGIVSARIFPKKSDAVEEVHVLAESSRHPKQIARDIESCLAAKFNIDVDHRRISVAQLQPQGVASPRFLLKSIHVKLDRIQGEVEVELKFRDRVYVGKSAGAFSGRSRFILAAEATLNAVAECLQDQATLFVEGAICRPLGEESVAIVVIGWTDQNSQEALVGSVSIRRDEIDAVVQATLVAVNRKADFFYANTN